jgi:hypothetical protein
MLRKDKRKGAGEAELDDDGLDGELHDMPVAASSF